MAKTALITGASGGIGYEFAKIFAEKQNDLVLVARSRDKLEKIKESLEEKYHISVLIIPKDLTDEGAAQAVYDEVNAAGTEVEYLVNNAGFGDNNAFHDTALSVQENMVKLNVLALTQFTHLFGNDMKKRGSGKILNIASIAAFSAGPYMSVYYASKAFVLSFSEAVAEELRPHGVTVTCLCPGPTNTGFEAVADLEKARMFKFFKPAVAKDVAEYGYKAMMGDRTVIVAKGVKSTTVLSKLAPRIICRKFSKWINSPSKKA
ncbi:MAG: SDR family NAD(P)-dependent oxidoreductase [Oscillospiraceae bacterium]